MWLKLPEFELVLARRRLKGEILAFLELVAELSLPMLELCFINYAEMAVPAPKGL